MRIFIISVTVVYPWNNNIDDVKFAWALKFALWFVSIINRNVTCKFWLYVIVFYMSVPTNLFSMNLFLMNWWFLNWGFLNWGFLLYMTRYRFIYTLFFTLRYEILFFTRRSEIYYGFFCTWYII